MERVQRQKLNPDTNTHKQTLISKYVSVEHKHCVDTSHTAQRVCVCVCGGSVDFL